MRNLIAAVLLLGCGSAQAANVTIDFEQLAGVVTDFQPVGASVALNNGFVISGNNAIWLTDAAGPSPTSIDVVLNTPSGDVTLSKSDGSIFDLLGFDYAFLSQGIWPITMTAIKAGGTEVALELDLVAIDLSYATYIAGSLFTNIVSLNIQNGTDAPPMALDNINVSTVPIPAAVWLFGSALAGLGWMRRRKTA